MRADKQIDTDRLIKYIDRYRRTDRQTYIWKPYRQTYKQIYKQIEIYIQ